MSSMSELLTSVKSGELSVHVLSSAAFYLVRLLANLVANLLANLHCLIFSRSVAATM